jgi:hypothetical protein
MEVFTEPLPSNDRRDTHTDIYTDGKDLWGAIIYVPSFIKTGSGIQKLIGRDTDSKVIS